MVANMPGFMFVVYVGFFVLINTLIVISHRSTTCLVLEIQRFVSFSKLPFSII